MKTLQIRLLTAFGFLYAAVLVGLGFVLGQLFPVYMNNLTEKNASTMSNDITKYLQGEEISLSDTQQNALLEILPSGFASTEWHFWLLLIIILITVFCILEFITYLILGKLSNSIDHVTQTTKELAKGNYHVRVYESANVPTHELSKSVNVVAHELQALVLAREVEKERLNTLIDNMGSALIMIGRAGEISVVNGSFLTLFDKNHDDVKKHVFRELGVDSALEDFVDHVFMTETAYRKQLQIEIDQRSRHMEVYGAPVIGKHGHWLGVVIVMHDITELKKLEQVRKDFVANVSHELRTPITSIKGFSETLIDGAYKDEDTLLSFLEIMHKESNRLQTLVQDLLELSKIEQEGFKIDLVPTLLLDIVKSSIEMTKIQIESKQMNIKVNSDKEILVLGDANRLLQIIVNLLVNAVSYSKPEKQITVTIGSNQRYGYIDISDQGIGIEKKEIPRVFERFYRVDRARSRNSGGTGLGLAIVKHLVEAHDGRILVNSETDVGTTIRVSIPLAK